ncbi:MAG: glutathione ABC transporter permease GsiC [Deltaproteobacteria bacterium GWA2_38_16]|nr:MAG: glutathione ABC transporter permease GsiC [Deltaproteobacteria bacterium GWA2_38_16]OGQ01708.1 MAG: glutathione ABC transporter permease GsiC [Deltaproteobacteria bacterium RIFCSPHIGHO2_02_FULL_38_15]OGQ34831.1 MAG: glutathione ABC transporter permease GsiC [Deltaproteobacteria bacterium RIFCSPLOWO2_01_FULL_38_9]OGQ61216.1 MAG: glutathione ABC transporter permease GsiC [Deltaproteobacteria bacterium RIFCSPLOWO2_12_FULL_38_8]HBQ21804.1 glutathione ABC transporter permease GsiC [Deltaprot
MKAYILRRCLLLVPILFGITLIVFSFMHIIPGDPIDIMLGETAQAVSKDHFRKLLHQDKPIPLQYILFLKDVFTGNLKSIPSEENVWAKISERFPATAELAIWAMVFAIVISIPLGMLAAVKHKTYLDGISMLISLLGISIPHFWLGPLLIILFAYTLPIFPISERSGFLSIVLPAITLGTAMMALLSRLTRTSTLEIIREDYIRTARAKGLSETTILFKHVLKNTLVPVITIAGIQMGALLSGSIITETVFDWPGIGSLLVEAIQSRNYPLVQGCVILIATLYVVINLLTDILYAWADPRIRLQ